METLGEISLTKKIKANKLVASVIHPTEISNDELKRMYHLFTQYYAGHNFESFKHDLLAKDDVILLKCDDVKEIQGFSTIIKVKITIKNKLYRGMYSGDTVVSTEYWGSPALGNMFLKYLWWHKIKNPFSPLYWFLISKGYKTYLLMANNFQTHYPRFEEETPAFYQELMDSFYEKKFKETYSSEENLMTPVGETCYVKNNIANIDEKLLKLPRVSFFTKKNPNWQSGTELCCIARMTLLMPLKYAVKKFVKGLLK